MRTIVCLGAGVTGVSVARLCVSHGWQVMITDDAHNKAYAACEKLSSAWVSAHSVADMMTLLHTAAVDSVIVSPGIKLSHPLLVLARQKNIAILGDIEFGLQLLPKKGPQLVAITGSNGKTTVTLLVEHMLRYAGKKAKAVGNVGNAFLDYVIDPQEEVLVLEISSQQLEYLYCSDKEKIHPVFDAGCIVNISPNHLDWHGSMEDYVAAKLKLSSLVKQDGMYVSVECMHYPELYGKAHVIGRDVSMSATHVVRFRKEEALISEKLQKSFAHDKENFLFAYAIAVQLGVKPEVAMLAYESFTKPEHRIQFLKTHQGISYYDDSKGTNIAAVIRAVTSVPGPVHLIAGGVHKGEPYSSWIPYFKGVVNHVFAIGEAKTLIQQDLEPAIQVTLCDSLESAFALACNFSVSSIAKEGGSVLLSPGCSSWDMFQSYKERGKRFQELVAKLR